MKWATAKGVRKVSMQTTPQGRVWSTFPLEQRKGRVGQKTLGSREVLRILTFAS